MSMMARMIIGLAAVLALVSVAHAGDQGDPEQSCDGNTYQMVECLKAKTAQWDKRLNVAYQKAVQDAQPAQRDQLRAAQRLWVIASITASARAPSRGSMPANACAA
jgi:uncharacterized protein YecT (DUF1311 family)